MKNIRKRNKEGFTIIEVMIVLAIAALILLVVFLAIPSLQRSQRNSARKSDASRIAASVVDFTSNNSGSLPTTNTQCDSIISAAASLSQYNSLGACVQGVALPAAPTKNTMYLEIMTADGSIASNKAVENAMLLATKASCTLNANNAVTFDSATSRKVALMYSVEAGTGWDWACINPQ